MSIDRNGGSHDRPSEIIHAFNLYLDNLTEKKNWE